MKSRKLAVISGSVGLVLAAGLVVLGLVMAGNARFAKTYVKDQLSQQRIRFAALDTLTEDELTSPCLRDFAGRLLTTGKQAECYANEFIARHVKEVAGGQTYAEVGIPERALSAQVDEALKANPNDPALPDMQKRLAGLRAQRGTLFQGETSRGLLLTSFGFSDLGVKAAQAATASFAIAALLALLSLAALLYRPTPRKAQAAPKPELEESRADKKQAVAV